MQNAILLNLSSVIDILQFLIFRKEYHLRNYVKKNIFRDNQQIYILFIVFFIVILTFFVTIYLLIKKRNFNRQEKIHFILYLIESTRTKHL